jgi:hypothetical protein
VKWFQFTTESVEEIPLDRGNRGIDPGIAASPAAHRIGRGSAATIGSVTPRSRKWLLIVGTVAAIDFALTLHSTLTWSPTPGGPTVAPIGQLLGWFSTIGLLSWVAFILIGAVRNR